MARKERTLKNSISAVAKFAVKLILQFVLRTIIIYELGVNYVGLDSLYANIISVLSLAELGIGSAIVFSMYKPAAENDIEKLKSLNNLYKKIYLIIASIVLVVGLSLVPFLDFFINGEANVDVNLKIVYLVFLFNTVISYLGAHKRSLLFAFQRNDIENNVTSTQLMVMTFVQVVLLLIFKNYYVYVITIPIFTILEVILVTVLANKMFPKIRGKGQPIDKETKSAIVKNIIATSCHHLGAVVVMSTDNILISSFFGLTTLGTISNYILIYNAINSLVKLLISAMRASVGNLIAVSETEKVYKFYKTINWGFSCFVGFCTIALMCLYEPFMNMWVGKQEFVVTFWIILSIVLKFYFTETRQVTNMFKNCAGLMWQDRIKPIVEAVVNLVVSIALLKWIGVAGVFVGTIISTIVAPFWVEPWVLHKHYFKKSVKSYFAKYLFYFIITCLAGSLTYFVCWLLPAYGLGWFILKCVICVVIPCSIFLLCYFKTKEFKQAMEISVKPIFEKIKKKRGQN